MQKTTDNFVKISGVISNECTFSHEIVGENFYSFNLECVRTSGISDYIPVLVSDRLIEIENLKPGSRVYIEGQFRSYNKLQSDGHRKLILHVFASCVEPYESEDDINEISLNGYICKDTVYRTTPQNREITDILLATNRAYGKSDYIPLICWGRNARYASRLDVGTQISIFGRVQSRRYFKKLSEEYVEERIAYEVSVSRIINETNSEDE